MDWCRGTWGGDLGVGIGVYVLRSSWERAGVWGLLVYKTWGITGGRIAGCW